MFILYMLTFISLFYAIGLICWALIAGNPFASHRSGSQTPEDLELIKLIKMFILAVYLKDRNAHNTSAENSPPLALPELPGKSILA